MINWICNHFCPQNRYRADRVVRRLRRVLAAGLVGASVFTAAAEDALTDQLREILDAGQPDDYALLGQTCFTEFEDWLEIGDENRSAQWTAATFRGITRFANAAAGQPLPPRVFVQPGAALKPLAGWVAVPESGSYRLWLGHLRTPGQPAPVTLRVSGATTLEHVFGEANIPRGETGRAIEGAQPVRFETDEARTIPALAAAPVWEFWDVELQRGATRLELAPQATNAALEALVLTRSKRFTPSRALDESHNTLTQVYLRYRVSPADPAVVLSPLTLDSHIIYNWEHNEQSSPTDIYFGSVGAITAADGKAAIASAQWSAWVNCTTSAVTRRGRYATDNLTLASTGGGARPTNVLVDVQYAWFPHPAAVLREVRAHVTSGGMRYTIPATRFPYRAVRPGADAASAAWGARDPGHADLFRGEKQILDDLFASLDTLDKGREVLPKRLAFYTSCGVSPEYLELAVPRLKALGINTLGFSRETNARFGLLPHTVAALQEPRTRMVGDTHDPADPTFEARVRETLEKRFPPERRDEVTLFGMGDEIGPISPALIRDTADGRRAFRDYLEGELTRMGTNAGFFGVASLEDLAFPLERPLRASRQQRRLWFHAEDFLWRYTSDYYRRYTRAITAVLPRARTFCNVTPGSFMNTGTMRRSNWFALPRQGGSTLGWGEDWLRGADVQPVSYYAALLACATRKHQLPSGFYLVSRTGNTHRKMFSLIARGIHFINLYTWGPEYAGFVGERFSHVTNAYPEIIRGIQALAPAEDMITQGTPEPRRAALLYNLTNEHWNEAEAGLHRDRLSTFLALLHAHVPVDVILEEDLTPEALAAYPVVYIQGFNMRRRHILALTEWVKAGGVLVASSGAALRDEYDDPMPEAEILFGARQRLAGEPDRAVAESVPADNAADAMAGEIEPGEAEQARPAAMAMDRLTLSASGLTEAVSLSAFEARLVLTPTTGRPVGAYADGRCGAVVHELGKGRVLLLGVMPGHAYGDALARDAGQAGAVRQAIAKPALQALGPLPVEYSEPLVEVSRFDHDSGIAVMLTDFSYAPGRAATLVVRTKREVKDVIASHGGRLEWKREGDCIVIRAPVPDPVDVIVLR